MKKSFLEIFLDKIKSIFLTFLRYCVLFVPSFGRKAIVRHFKDTELFKDEKVNVVCVGSKRSFPTITNSISRNSIKVIKSVQKLREEKQMQLRESKVAMTGRYSTKTQAMINVKQNVAKYYNKEKENDRERDKEYDKEKDKENNRNYNKRATQKVQQKDSIRTVYRGKSRMKMEISSECLTTNDQQRGSRSIWRDLNKVSNLRNERSCHEQHRDRKYSVCKSQELLMSERMSEAERMRRAMKNYSELLKKKQNEKRQSIIINNETSESNSREASVIGIRRKIESKQDSIREKTFSVRQRSRESVSNCSKCVATCLAEKLQPNNFWRKRELKSKAILPPPPPLLPPPVNDRPKSTFSETHKDKVMTWPHRNITKAASTNDLVEKERLAKYQERKELLKNFTITMKLDIKKKYERVSEYQKEVKPKLARLGTNEVVPKVSKTSGLKESLVKARKNTLEMIASGKSPKEIRKKPPINLTEKEKARVNAKFQRVKAKLEKAVNQLEVKDIAIPKPNATMREVDLPDKQQGQQQLRREATIVLRKIGSQERVRQNGEEKPQQDQQGITENATHIELTSNELNELEENCQKTYRVSKTEEHKNYDGTLLEQEINDDGEPMECAVNDSGALIEPQFNYIGEFMAAQNNHDVALMEQGGVNDDGNYTGREVNLEDLEILEKLRIMRQLDKVERDLLENEIFLDFLTSDEEELKSKLDELELVDNQQVVKEEAENTIEHLKESNTEENRSRNEVRKRQQSKDRDKEMLDDISSAKRMKEATLESQENEEKAKIEEHTKAEISETLENCTEKEKQLLEKEKELMEKEKALIEREKELAEREKEIGKDITAEQTSCVLVDETEKEKELVEREKKICKDINAEKTPCPLVVEIETRSNESEHSELETIATAECKEEKELMEKEKALIERERELIERLKGICTDITAEKKPEDETESKKVLAVHEAKPASIEKQPPTEGVEITEKIHYANLDLPPKPVETVIEASGEKEAEKGRSELSQKPIQTTTIAVSKEGEQPIKVKQMKVKKDSINTKISQKPLETTVIVAPKREGPTIKVNEMNSKKNCVNKKFSMKPIGTRAITVPREAQPPNEGFEMMMMMREIDEDPNSESSEVPDDIIITTIADMENKFSSKPSPSGHISLGEEDRETVKDITKEILELIIKSRLPSAKILDEVQIEQLEEKVVDKLEETMNEKLKGKALSKSEEMADGARMTDDICAGDSVANDIGLHLKNSKPTTSSLQLQLRDVINDTNEIDEMKIVSAVVVLMSNIIERACLQQHIEQE